MSSQQKDVKDRLGLGTVVDEATALREYAELLDILYPPELLSRLEILALAELFETTPLSAETAAQLADLVDAACEQDELHARWQIDREGLVAKLRGSSPAENWAIYERIRRWQREKTDEVWAMLDFPTDTP